MKTNLSQRIIRLLPSTGLTMSALGLMTILCFVFPEFLTTPAIRENYPIPLIREAMSYGLMLAGAITMYSLLFLPQKRLSFMALGLLIVCAALGGSQVHQKPEYNTFVIQIGLDWFVLDLLILAAIFIPLEALFARQKKQGLMRRETLTDLAYFAVGHLGFQFIMLLTQKPADELLALVRLPGQQSALSELPLAVQIILALFIADSAQYWIHRTMHRIPKLWRFHEIHHSIKRMDWLAGSRLHIVDIMLIRGPVYATVMFIGLAPEAIIGYILIMAFHTVLLHANVGINFGWLRYVIATPQYHHWHHNDQQASYDKNFAVHFPVIDWMFGTFYLPGDQWPTQYGVRVPGYPSSYWGQFLFPFKAKSNISS